MNYGFLGGHKLERLAPMPLAHEITIRARAQSILSRGGRAAPLPSIEDPKRIIARAEKPPRVLADGRGRLPFVARRWDE